MDFLKFESFVGQYWQFYRDSCDSRLYFPNMVTAVFSILNALLQCDSALLSARVGTPFHRSGASGHLNREDQKWFFVISEAGLWRMTQLGLVSIGVRCLKWEQRSALEPSRPEKVRPHWGRKWLLGQQRWSLVYSGHTPDRWVNKPSVDTLFSLKSLPPQAPESFNHGFQNHKL